jgi:hypothetical protein
MLDCAGISAYEVTIMFGRYLARALGLLLMLTALAALRAEDDPKKPPAKKATAEDKKPVREREEKKPAPRGKDTDKKPAAPRETEFKSGPQKGELIGGSFAPFNINGKRKDRYHCLVCEFGAEPAVAVFAREPAEGKDEALSELLKQLDDAVERHQDKFLHAFVVFLSPDAPKTAAGEESAEGLVKEAGARAALTMRLQNRAEKLKNVILSYFPPEGPKGYKIHQDAEVTVLFYTGFKVDANFAFRPGEFQPENVKTIIKTIDDKLGRPKRFSPKPAAG